MRVVLRLLLIASTAALSGCYVYPAGPGPAPVAGPAYVARPGPVWVPGHFGPGGYWIPGHYR